MQMGLSISGLILRFELARRVMNKGDLPSVRIMEQPTSNRFSEQVSSVCGVMVQLPLIHWKAELWDGGVLQSPTPLLMRVADLHLERFPANACRSTQVSIVDNVCA